jgi:hypothetical protein
MEDIAAAIFLAILVHTPTLAVVGAILLFFGIVFTTYQLIIAGLILIVIQLVINLIYGITNKDYVSKKAESLEGKYLDKPISKFKFYCLMSIFQKYFITVTLQDGTTIKVKSNLKSLKYKTGDTIPLLYLAKKDEYYIDFYKKPQIL